MKFSIFTKIDKDLSQEEKSLFEHCLEKGLILDNDNPDYVFVLGGDGTFLRAVHHFLDQVDKVKFIGIRCGTLGFFYEFNKEDIPEVIDLLINNKYREEIHSLIECRLGEEMIYAVNEIRFENPFHTLKCSVQINDYELETFRGDGLSISGELGSTAYNKSLGGAIISHKLSLLQLTEISPIQNNIYRSLGSPIIVPPQTTFTFKGDFENVVVGYDFLTLDCDDVKEIKVKYSDRQVHIVYKDENQCLNSLKRSFVK